jgi:hypothetical protein
MIITKLGGGLGNQMFQYAFARSLQLKHKTSLKIDAISFNDKDRKKHENLQLNLFPNIDVTIASKKEIFFFMRKTLWGSKLLFNLKWKIGKYSIHIEPSFNFQQLIPNRTSKNCYIVGYWQSEKYFKHIRQTLLNDFLFPPFNDKNRKIEGIIRSSNSSISIHIRRGDYISDKLSNKNHGFIGLQYYEYAIARCTKNIYVPLFFVFSDDIEWVRKHLKLPADTIYVDWNKNDEAINDIHLMSLCQHNIIANSSFSWWAAWLNQNPNKIVIAPKKWFNERDWDTSDLIPENWISL